MLIAVPMGIVAAAEITVHAQSGAVLVSNRGILAQSSVRVLLPTPDGGLAPSQDVRTGANPRHIALMRGGKASGGDDVLVVGVEGGVETYAISADGVLRALAVAPFASDLAKLAVDAVAPTSGRV